MSAVYDFRVKRGWKTMLQEMRTCGYGGTSEGGWGHALVAWADTISETMAGQVGIGIFEGWHLAVVVQ